MANSATAVRRDGRAAPPLTRMSPWSPLSLHRTIRAPSEVPTVKGTSKPRNALSLCLFVSSVSSSSASLPSGSSTLSSSLTPKAFKNSSVEFSGIKQKTQNSCIENTGLLVELCLFRLFHLLMYVSTCCNPITYCFLHSKFRQSFLQAITCKKNKPEITDLLRSRTTKILSYKSRTGTNSLSTTSTNKSAQLHSGQYNLPDPLHITYTLHTLHNIHDITYITCNMFHSTMNYLTL